MSILFLILIYAIIGGTATASFASERYRNQAAWFVIGALTGPLAMLVLLLLPVLPERKTVMKGQTAVLAVLVVIAAVVVAALAVVELFSQYEKSQRFTDLSTWELYGDALIRMGSAKDNPPEAFVVKAARNQVADHARDLRVGMRTTESELLLAIRGVEEVKGASGVFSNAFRILTFRSPLWPAPTGLSPEQQDERIRFLEGKLRSYREYLGTIETAQTIWQPSDG